MPDIKCPYCSSLDIYFSKKRNCFVCEDCEKQFSDDNLSTTQKSQRIFFSYGHDDNVPLVLKLKQDLESRGHHVWFDKNEIHSGADWRRSITDGLMNSNGVLSFLSKHSVRNPGVCLDELKIALCEKGNSVQTVLLESEHEVLPPASVSNIQWLDMSQWKTMKSEGESAWAEWYNQKFSELCKIVESPELLDFSGEITLLKQFLNPCLSDTKEQYLLSQPFFGREWLTQDILDWRDNAHDQRAYLLLGGPGFGKSCYAAHLMHFEPSVLCGLFCEWDKPQTTDAKSVICTIAYKLATKLPDYRRLLLSLFSVRKIGSELPNMQPADAFDALITSPVSHLIQGGRDTYIVVIDALDEATFDGQNQLARVLADNLYKLPNWIRFVLTSRPESNIVTLFKNYKPHSIEADASSNVNDIRGYLTVELKPYLEEVENKLQTIDKITENCQGSFLYASLFVEGIVSKSYEIEDVDSFLPGLDWFYYRNFTRKFADSSAYKTVRDALELVVAAGVIPVRVLRHISGMDKYDYLNFRNQFGSLLRTVSAKNQMQYADSVTFCHKSLADWLTNPSSNATFYVDGDSGTVRLANACKDILLASETIIDDVVLEFAEKNVCYFFQKAGLWKELENFLNTAPLKSMHYWHVLNKFPAGWDMQSLITTFYHKDECVPYLAELQRAGESQYVRFVLEKIIDFFWIETLSIDAIKIYIDIVHLSGDYRLAVDLSNKYLSQYSQEEISADRNLLFMAIRKNHHSMFFAPVEDLIQDSIKLYESIDNADYKKEINEILFLIGGNLGVLSGNYDFASDWVGKSYQYAIDNNLPDFQERAIRKKVDLLISRGQYVEALELASSKVSVSNDPQNRYQLYLLASLAECYRHLKNFELSYQCYKKVSEFSALLGIPGWHAHSYLGLANLYLDFEFYKEAQNMCTVALDKYIKIDQKWGIANAKITGFRIAIAQNIPVDKNEYEELLQMVKQLQYRQETRMIESLIDGESPEGWNLMFL